ncbi:sulfotransferase [Nonomuraea antimicrobica]
MGVVQKGFKRRARLLREALRPPWQPAGPETNGSAFTASAGVRRPPKRTQVVDYTFPAAPRLVKSPVFVISPVRSGSTLLRMLLNSHSRIRAPHELHLRTIGVELTPASPRRPCRSSGSTGWSWSTWCGTASCTWSCCAAARTSWSTRPPATSSSGSG